MNKTWSIILIVIASIAILGGTFWFFEMRTPAVQESQTSAPVQKTPTDVPTTTPKTESVQKKAPEAVTSPVQSSEKVEAPKDALVTEPTSIEENPTPLLIAEEQSEENLMPPPISPILSNGSLRLPPLSAGVGALPVPSLQAESKPTLETTTEEPTSVTETPVSTQPLQKEEEAKPLLEKPSSMPTTSAVEVMEEAAPNGDIVKPDIQAQKEPVMETSEVVVEPEPELTSAEESFTPIPKMPTSVETKSEIETEVQKLEANLSISFLNFNYPGANKSFAASFDFLVHQDAFAYGGTLEVGKVTSLNELQVSLLGKLVWTLGKHSEVTFPLSISLGPTMFYDTDISWGLTAKLNAGVNYAVTDSIWFFYSVGVGYQLNVTDMVHRFVLEPMRIGVGIRF